MTAFKRQNNRKIGTTGTKKVNNMVRKHGKKGSWDLKIGRSRRGRSKQTKGKKTMKMED